MDEPAAQKQANEWWGEYGRATVQRHRSSFGGPLWSEYKVGLSLLSLVVGGRVAHVWGRSRVSFEDAFRKARAEGYGPGFDIEEEEVDPDYQPFIYKEEEKPDEDRASEEPSEQADGPRPDAEATETYRRTL